MPDEIQMSSFIRFVGSRAVREKKQAAEKTKHMFQKCLGARGIRSAYSTLAEGVRRPTSTKVSPQALIPVSFSRSQTISVILEHLMGVLGCLCKA